MTYRSAIMKVKETRGLIHSIAVCSLLTSFSALLLFSPRFWDR